MRPLVIIGALGAAVWFLQRGASGGKRTLERWSYDLVDGRCIYTEVWSDRTSSASEADMSRCATASSGLR